MWQQNFNRNRIYLKSSVSEAHGGGTSIFHLYSRVGWWVSRLPVFGRPCPGPPVVTPPRSFLSGWGRKVSVGWGGGGGEPWGWGKGEGDGDNGDLSCVCY